MELETIMKMVVGIIAVVIIIFSFQVFAPRLAHAVPGVNDTLTKLGIGKQPITSNPIEPPADVKAVYDKFLSLFKEQAGKPDTKNCFVSYTADLVRKDFAGFSVNVENVNKGILLKAPPAGAAYIQNVDGIKVDCVVEGSNLAANILANTPINPISQKSTVLSLVGSKDGSFTLKGDAEYFIVSDKSLYPYLNDLYLYKGDKEICIVVKMPGYLGTCKKLSPLPEGGGKALSDEECLATLKEKVKICS